MLERFGWTQDDLDAADMGRLLPGIRALDLYREARRFHQGEDVDPATRALIGEVLTEARYE